MKRTSRILLTALALGIFGYTDEQLLAVGYSRLQALLFNLILVLLWICNIIIGRFNNARREMLKREDHFYDN